MFLCTNPVTDANANALVAVVSGSLCHTAPAKFTFACSLPILTNTIKSFDRAKSVTCSPPMKLLNSKTGITYWSCTFDIDGFKISFTENVCIKTFLIHRQNKYNKEIFRIFTDVIPTLVSLCKILYDFDTNLCYVFIALYRIIAKWDPVW